MRKRVISTIAAAAFMLALSGCGGDSKKDSTAEAVEAVVIEDNEDWTTTEVQVEEDDKFSVTEGEELLGFDFEDSSVDSFTTYLNTGSYELTAENGELVCDIQSVGTLDYACQLGYDGFRMVKGCVYTISFDVRSDIARSIEWRVQINGGDYHPYVSEIKEIGPETQTITCEFTMEEESDPAPRLVFNMGLFEGMTDTAHKIFFDNISLIVTDASNVEQIEGAPTPVQVKVNQIGYAPDDVKTVITTSSNDEKFKIVKADTEETVYIGEYEDVVYDETVDSAVRKGDFTDFKATGSFKIISSPSGESYEFSIGEGLYDAAYKDIVLMLYNQRCGCDLDSSISGDFAHTACHMSEAVAYDETSDTHDVSGGWHDAGDYGRYVVSGAKTVQDLMLAYEDYDYDNDEIGIPESGNDIPDLLDEAKYELDWMFKMQKDDGGVYHKVTCSVFPETVLPTEETDQLILAPVSYAATADFAAVMAKASIVYEEFDEEFAAKCLEAAKKAYDYLEANPEKKNYTNPEAIVTGEYPDTKLEDELLWAAAELYIATGETKYMDTVNAQMAVEYQKGFGWADIGSYALYDLANSAADDTLKNSTKETFIATADELLAKCKEEPFATGLGTRYPWGSNMNVADNGAMFLRANKLNENPEYIEYASKQRDYLFGVNGTGYCYVTGYGTLSPESTHHRPSQVLGISMPGMLVGGADNALEDTYASAVLDGYAPALCYVDNEQAYSCNEITVYWNSPLIYLMTGLK